MPLSNKETFPCRPPWSLARIKSQSRTEGRKTPSGKYLSTFFRKKNKRVFLCFTPPENEFGNQTSFKSYRLVRARTSPNRPTALSSLIFHLVRTPFPPILSSNFVVSHVIF